MVVNEGYIEAKFIIDNMKDVNDSAKRGVKLCSYFLESAR